MCTCCTVHAQHTCTLYMYNVGAKIQIEFTTELEMLILVLFRLYMQMYMYMYIHIHISEAGLLGLCKANVWHTFALLCDCAVCI